MGKDPAMPLYVNDWLSSPKIACMTPAQELGYFRLLCYCWSSGCASVPDDDEVLAKLSGMGEGWFKGGSQMVRDCFEPNPNQQGFLTNKRLMELWTERQEWREKSKLGGIKSGKLRKNKAKTKSKGGSTTLGTKREPNGNSSSSSSSTSSSSLLKEKEKQKDKFEQFWICVKTKVGKTHASKLYAVAVQDLVTSHDDPHGHLIDRLEAYQASDRFRSEFAWEPCAWLRDGHYDDDPKSWNRGPGTSTPKQSAASARRENNQKVLLGLLEDGDGDQERNARGDGSAVRDLEQRIITNAG
ncbi:MAG: hypothetical protein ABGX16_07765 [Pirellulales bacterium]